MPYCPPNIIDVLAHQPPGTYTKEMLRYPKYRQNWWFNRIGRKPYPQGLGPNPLRRVAALQRGGEIFPFRQWKPSNGDGSATSNMAAGQPIGTAQNAGCCPPVVQYNRGYAQRPINTFDLGRQSRTYCAKDFTQSLDPKGDLDIEFQGYSDQNEQTLSTFNRNEYIRLCLNKIYAKPGNGLFNRVAEQLVGDPSQYGNAYAGVAGGTAALLGLDINQKPTSMLTQDLLDRISQYLNAFGVQGIKTTNGAQIYELVTSSTTAQSLLMDNTVATAFNYADMGQGDQAKLLGALGQSLEFRGYIYQQDVYTPRLDANFNLVPATITVNTDSGTEDVMNPAWFQAPYEVSIVYTDSVMDLAFPDVKADPGGNIAFLNYNYMGELMFTKLNPESAPLGNMGYFYSEFFVASMAAQQRYGFVLVHLNCQAAKFKDCSGNITTY